MGQERAIRADFAAPLPGAASGGSAQRGLFSEAAHQVRLLVRRRRQREIAERAPQLHEFIEMVDGARVEVDAKLEIREGAVPAGLDFTFFASGRFRGARTSLRHLLDCSSSMLAFDVSSRESRVRVRYIGESRRDDELAPGRSPLEGAPERAAGPGRWRITGDQGRLGVHGCVVWRGQLIVTTGDGYHCYDADTLEPVREGGGLPRQLAPAADRRFALHPQIDGESGRLLTHTCELGATFSSRFEFLELDGFGEPRRASYEWPSPLLAHAFGFTRGHYLLPELPVALEPMGFVPGLGRATRSGVRGDSGRRLRVHVVPRDPARSPLSVVFQMHGFIYHVVNSWEEAGTLVFDAFVSDQNPERQHSDLGLDPTRPVWTPLGGLFRFSVDLVSGTASKRLLAHDVQRAGFHCIDEARRGRPHRAAWFAANEQHERGRSHLVRLEAGSGMVQRWSWDERVFLRQPRLVGRGGGEEDGWLVVPLLRSRETQLAIFDSGRIDRGPVAVLGAGTRLPCHGHTSVLSRIPG